MLSFTIADVVNVPFGYIMDGLYRLTQNYGLSVILFGICVSLLMYPLNVRNRINSVKQARLKPIVNKIREAFPGDVKMQNKLMEELYDKENVSISGGCLLSLIPIFILIALYGVVSQPIVYMLHESKETAQALIEHIQKLNPELIGENAAFAEVIASNHLADFAESIKATFPAVKDATLQGINYNFLGLNLAQNPQLDFTKWTAYDWPTIGLFALPILTVAVHIVPSFVSKIKAMIAASKAKKQGVNIQTNASGKKMSLFLVFVWFMFALACFQVPGVLALYWFAKSCADNILEIFIRKSVKKIPPMKTDIEAVLRTANAEKENLKKADKAN